MLIKFFFFFSERSINLAQDCTSAQQFASIGSIIPILVIVTSFYGRSVGYSFREKKHRYLP